MRISQMVASSQFQAQFQAQAKPSAGADNVQASSRGLGSAQRTNQARLTDASNGFLQASRVRDGVASVSDGVGKASALLEKAKGANVSAADRKQLQTDFSKALAAVDQGVSDQGAALADKKLANKTYDASQTTVVSAGQLGKGASQQFSSVADLRKLDLNTASSAQLAEAAKVLDAAKGETKAQLTTADAQSSRASGRAGTFQAVQNTLTGSPTLDSRQQRNLSIIQALASQSKAMTPGSLFNSFG